MPKGREKRERIAAGCYQAQRVCPERYSPLAAPVSAETAVQALHNSEAPEAESTAG